MRKWPFLVLALFASLAGAQNLSQPILQPHINLVDGSGSPCAGCSLYSYSAGTTTPKPTYTNAGMTVQNTNPIVLDAAGGATIWLDLNGYKFVLNDANGGLVWSVDNVVSVASLGCLGNNAISKGCTGATTSQGAATNIVDGNNILPASVQNANVNGIYVVTKYGAVGDCTGSGSTATCTNNHDAIQAAIDAAYATGGAVYLPTRTAAVGQTVYYTATAINPKGVSIYGPPGAGGPFESALTQYTVVVRGAPGKDVFDVVDPTDPSYVAPLPTFTWKDWSIIVDDTVDVSASFTTRRPGRTCKDAVANGTTVITSAAQCMFQPGDVGQAITVGATTTTVASWQSATQVTLAATVTTGTGLTAYISLAGISATQNIGNCGLAYDDSTGIAGSSVHPTKSYFQDFSIHGITGHQNASCGFFFQANASPTHTHWQDVSVAGVVYGFSFVPVPSVAPSSSIYTGIADYNVFEHMFIEANYPFTAYSGELQWLLETQIFSVPGIGPQLLDAYGAVNGTSTWTIDIPEMESNCTAGTPVGFRIAGVNNHIHGLAAGGCPNGVIQWDASASQVDNMLIGTSNPETFNLAGKMNGFYQPSGGDNFAHLVVNDTGAGNTFKTGTQWNPFGGQPGRAQYAVPALGGLASAPYGTSTLSRGSVSLNRTSDFLRTGASSYYFNAEDLWFWPKELLNSVTGTSPTVAADATTPTGANFKVAAAGSQNLSTSDAVDWYLGSQIPAGKMRVYVLAKAASASNLTITAQAYYSAAWHTLGTPCVISIASTSYAVYSCDVDASGLSGDRFLLNLAAATVDTYFGWVGIRPIDSDPTGWSSGTGSGTWWEKDPLGKIEEHGCVNVTAGGTTHVTGTVTFPLTFPNALESLAVAATNSPDGGDGGTAGTSTWFTSTSTSGATVNYRCVVDVGGGGCAAISNTVPICWIAIGR